MEQELLRLQTTAKKLSDDSRKIREQKQTLSFKAREQAQQKIQQLNLAFENQQEELLEQLREEIARFEQAQQRSTDETAGILLDAYARNVDSAVRQFIKEVSAYGDC